jgi:uncharacterized protein YyaL (SSP411 family)
MGQTFQSGQAAQAIQRCASQLAERFDPALGGFGGAPKFPRPAEINLLHVAHLRGGMQDGSVSSSSVSTSGAASLPIQNTWHTRRSMPEICSCTH